jgi:hypothetical protein
VASLRCTGLWLTRDGVWCRRRAAGQLSIQPSQAWHESLLRSKMACREVCALVVDAIVWVLSYGLHDGCRRCGRRVRALG